MPVRHVLLALVVVAIWGFNFTMIKLSVEAMPPLFAAGLRFTFAALPLVFFLKPPKTHWLYVVGFGLAFGFGLYSFLNMALYWGMPAGLSSLVLQVQAFFTMLFAFLVLGERPRRVQVVGAGIAFCGIGVIALERIEATAIVPLLLTILAAVAWGVANVLTKKAGRVDPTAFTVWGALAAPLPLFALSLGVEGPEAIGAAITGFSWADAGLIAFLAYPATLLGGAIWAWLLGRHPASTVAPFTLLVPIVGILSGALILHERITLVEIGGGVLILLGLLVPALLPTRSGAAMSRAAQKA